MLIAEETFQILVRATINTSRQAARSITTLLLKKVVLTKFLSKMFSVVKTNEIEKYVIIKSRFTWILTRPSKENFGCYLYLPPRLPPRRQKKNRNWSSYITRNKQINR